LADWRNVSRIPVRNRTAIGAGYDRIVVLSHSLGTVAAATSVCSINDSRIRLITTGSPISCLHGRFLGWQIEDEPDFTNWPDWWENLYNYGDYIGGPIELPEEVVRNIDLHDTPRKRDGHVGYWTEPAVLDAVKRALADTAQHPA